MARTLRKTAPVPATPAPSRQDARVLLAGWIVGVSEAGQVLFTAASGEEIPCRCPQHVSVGWLRAAVARAPVQAEIAATGGLRDGSLWCVFPGPEHEGIAAPTLELSAAETLRLSCGKSTLTLTRDGKARLRGREVTVRGSRAARVSGGVVKIN